MRTKFETMLFVVVLAACISLISLPAGGDGSPGIRKDHLDKTPKAFVDNDRCDRFRSADDVGRDSVCSQQ